MAHQRLYLRKYPSSLALSEFKVLSQYREWTVGPLKSKYFVSRKSHYACHYHNHSQSIACSGHWQHWTSCSQPVNCIMIGRRVAPSELKTTGTTTLENGVMFEWNQVVRNFNTFFPHLISSFSLKEPIAKQVAFVKASNYTLNLSQNFGTLLVVAQFQTIEWDWHCTSMSVNLALKMAAKLSFQSTIEFTGCTAEWPYCLSLYCGFIFLKDNLFWISCSIFNCYKHLTTTTLIFHHFYIYLFLVILLSNSPN